MKKFVRAVLPAFLLAISVGQIYAFTNFSDEIARHIGEAQKSVQFAFSLGIFFLGMGAAFFGKIVEKNLRLSTVVGTLLFVSGLVVTALGISAKSLPLVYLGYGFLVGTGTGIIYIAPVKTMMLWFPDSKAIAAAIPIVSFGLGSTLSTLLYRGIGGADSVLPVHLVGLRDAFQVAENSAGIVGVFYSLAAFYVLPMAAAVFLLARPKASPGASSAAAQPEFSYAQLLKDSFFLRAWLFMFLNICAGLSLIPLAKQMMKVPSVGYAEGVITTVIALAGVMNGGGRLIFAWWSDRLRQRTNILLFILAISFGIMTMSIWPPMIGLAILVINACYGAGFSVIPAILADNYGLANLSKVLGAVLSAWGFAGLVGNQTAMFVAKTFGGYGEGGHGYVAVVVMLIAVYALNFANAWTLKRSLARS